MTASLSVLTDAVLRLVGSTRFSEAAVHEALVEEMADCEKGQTAKETGCTPEEGGGGKVLTKAEAWQGRQEERDQRRATLETVEEMFEKPELHDDAAKDAMSDVADMWAAGAHTYDADVVRSTLDTALEAVEAHLEEVASQFRDAGATDKEVAGFEKLTGKSLEKLHDAADAYAAGAGKSRELQAKIDELNEQEPDTSEELPEEELPSEPEEPESWENQEIPEEPEQPGEPEPEESDYQTAGEEYQEAIDVWKSETQGWKDDEPAKPIAAEFDSGVADPDYQKEHAEWQKEHAAWVTAKPAEPNPEDYAGATGKQYAQEHAAWAKKQKAWHEEYAAWEQQVKQLRSDNVKARDQWEDDHAEWESEVAKAEEAHTDRLEKLHDRWEAAVDKMQAKLDAQVEKDSDLYTAFEDLDGETQSELQDHVTDLISAIGDRIDEEEEADEEPDEEEADEENEGKSVPEKHAEVNLLTTRPRRFAETTDRGLAVAPLAVPVVLQGDGFGCGRAALQSVFDYFHAGPPKQGQTGALLGTDPAAGTRPREIVEALTAVGLDVEEQHGMTLADLWAACAGWRPVLVPLQRHGGGHWCVVTGVRDVTGDSQVTAMDPSEGTVTIPKVEWLAAWHDTSADGEDFRRYGIVARGEQDVEAFADCLPGQRADETGCTPHPGAEHGSAVKVKTIKQRAFNGEPVATQKTLSKQETGRVGEAVILSYLKAQGFKDARPMNTGKTNFPVDVIEDHQPTEIKAGLVSNSRKAQQWRLTFSKESAKEKELYEQMNEQERSAWNAKKQARIKKRKEAVIRTLEKQNPGQKIKPRTMTVVINPDTRTADIYEFDGFHDRIDWRSEAAKKGYKATVQYGH